MMYVLIGMGFFFVAIGFILNENNAQHLLSGYNTLSEEEREKVDLKSYISYFRNFHIFLGLSFLIIGLSLTCLVSENAGGIFLGVYPLLAYIYFIVNSAKFSKGIDTRWNKVTVFILAGSLIFVTGLFGLAFKEDKLIINSENIELEGSYGEKLTPAEIECIALTSNTSHIAMKSNGFALGTIKKGYFKTSEGETIKLILNADIKPYILITKKSGGKIYYSAKENNNETTFSELKKTFPGIVYKN